MRHVHGRCCPHIPEKSTEIQGRYLRAGPLKDSYAVGVYAYKLSNVALSHLILFLTQNSPNISLIGQVWHLICFFIVFNSNFILFILSQGWIFHYYYNSELSCHVRNCWFVKKLVTTKALKKIRRLLEKNIFLFLCSYILLFVLTDMSRSFSKKPRNEWLRP